MKKIIIVLVLAIIVGLGIWGWRQTQESPVEPNPALNLNEELSLVGLTFNSVDLASSTIQADDITSGSFVIVAEKAVIFQYTNDPSCTVSCSQPQSLINIDENIQKGRKGGYEVKGVWAKVGDKNVLEASEIKWQ